jgi:hypothetical protein
MSMNILKVLESYRAPLGNKPEEVLSGRLAEARRLTKLMKSQKGFSYVRIGDKDLASLISPDFLNFLENHNKEIENGTSPAGTPGLLPEQVQRLKKSLERASYVDFWDRQWKSDVLLKQLNLNRPANAERNPDWNTSYIFPTWLEHEFKSYCNGRRILFCGAEVPILKELSTNKEFQQASSEFWPSNATIRFLTPRNGGKDPGENIDFIKEDLVREIKTHGIDTLFLSLGGVAKILCQEIAEELGICAFDFGLGLRSLSYAGSPGYINARSSHSVFLYRVPFEEYLDAVFKAYSTLNDEEVLAKIHSQIIFEIQKKEIGWSHTGWEYDFSSENLAYFYKAYRVYKNMYSYLFRRNAQTIKERNKFLHFCGFHKLTFEGRWFFVQFKAKNIVKKFLKK